MTRWIVFPLLAAVTAAAAPARAQQPAMPDPRSMSGRPLTVAEMTPGTVALRVVRQGNNPVVGAEVTQTTRTMGGESRSGAGKTGADGRVTFENLPLGAQFQANVTVDGERLETAAFVLPRTGGVRVMLIAGLGAAGAAAGGHGEGGDAPAAQPFRMGTATGSVAPVPDLPAGTLELDLRDAGGRALAGLKVQLAEVHLKAAPTGGQEPGREVGVHQGVTDSKGRVRFTGLATGEAAGYAAVTEHEGLRLGTQPFRMPAESGMRGQILALHRTTDMSALQLDPRSQVIFDLREDAVLVMMALILRNTSPEIFDLGEKGLVIPLPDGAVGAQEMEGGEPLEIVPGTGVRFKGTIPPDSSATFATRVRFGYVMPADGASALNLRQMLPVVMNDPFLLVPSKSGLSIDGPGVRRMKDEADSQGDKVFTYTTAPVAAGSALTLKIAGIPARDRSGRTVAAVLCVLLLGAAVVFAGPARGGGHKRSGSERNTLAERREKLFTELVAIEQQRRTDGEGAAPRAGANGKLVDRRRELVTKLEAVYRDLARLEDGPAA